ncbi:MAG TPA: UDP-N-acetylglucosamine 2-epimerase [Terriglobales bacterium]
MRSIGVVTVGRSDYGLYRPILECIAADPGLELVLIASGAGLAEAAGGTPEWVGADGFAIAERVEMLLSSDTPEAIAKSMGLGVLGFAQLWGRWRPDWLLLLGDRFEMYAAGLAALPFQIPIAHIHGGELTEGAFDDVLRHSLTKLSHLHFVAHPAYAARVLQLGEEPWRVVVSGAPGLDQIRTTAGLDRQQFEQQFGLTLPDRFALVTFHPATLEAAQAEAQCGELLAALNASGLAAVFTLPNADTNHRHIERLLAAYVAGAPECRIAPSLGSAGYFSLMRHAAVMVGNSSSGLLEAPSFALPVVNVGTRQDGRVRAANVIDCGNGRAEILQAMRRALAPSFRQALAGKPSPFGDGHAAERIVAALGGVALDARLLRKHFYDGPGGPPASVGGGSHPGPVRVENLKGEMHGIGG